MKALTELRRRYPWPDTIPDVAPDDHGWFQPCNARLLGRFLGPETRLIVELGSWLGKSARFMLEAAPQATVLCVDHWLGSPECQRPQLYETFLRNLWPWRDRVTAMRVGTIEGLHQIHGLGLTPQLIYVDAAHDYENVLADVTTSLDLFPAARIVGDDWLYYEGVRRAVTELARAREMSICRDENAWALR